jgi:hypothetical protein
MVVEFTKREKNYLSDRRAWRFHLDNYGKGVAGLDFLFPSFPKSCVNKLKSKT